MAARGYPRFTVHILLSDGTDIDVVLGRWTWEAAVIERSERLPIAPGVKLPVPALSDLILLKLAAGGFLDLHDAAALLEIGERATLEAEVESRIADVRPDICAAWRELLTRPG